MRGKVAVIIFVNEHKKILLYLRDNKPSIPDPNFWSILGGHVEKNETPLMALKREIKEEIDYDLKNPEFLGEFDDFYGNRVYTFFEKINKKLDELNLTEGQKLSYFGFDELRWLKMPLPLREFISKNKDKIFN